MGGWGPNIQQDLKILKDGDSAQIKNYRGSPNNGDRAFLVSLFTSAYSVLEDLQLLSVLSPPSHPFHLNHHTFPLTLCLNQRQQFRAIGSHCTHHRDREQIIDLLYNTTEDYHFLSQTPSVCSNLSRAVFARWLSSLMVLASQEIPSFLNAPDRIAHRTPAVPGQQCEAVSLLSTSD